MGHSPVGTEFAFVFPLARLHDEALKPGLTRNDLGKDQSEPCAGKLRPFPRQNT
jgi:hypothetical protein